MVSLEANYSGYTTPMFAFEEKFDEDAFLAWISENWTLSFWYSGIYVMMVFGGKHYMKSREKFDLRGPLVIWSAILAIFSIMGAVRTVPELIWNIYNYGVSQSVCSPSYFYGPTKFWAYMFVISKAYELGDTAFIVLRKQPLILLHWYHHISVFIYVWYSYTDHNSAGRWYCVMNYTVHSFMYTYYAFRAMRFRVPKSISIFITSIQIMQMGGGLTINLLSYSYKMEGRYCQQSFENIRYSLMMYLSYFLLFSYFFYGAYIKPKKPVEIVKEHNGIAKKVQ